MLTLPRHWFLGFLVLLGLFVAGFYYFRSVTRRAEQLVSFPTSTPSSTPTNQAATFDDSTSGLEQPTASTTLTPQPGVSFPSPPPTFVGQVKLIVPVAGISPSQLLDTFSDARDEGRTHDAIDIPAAAGTPVLAAMDGEIVKLFQSERGGTTIYQLTADRRLILYYAHLQGYAVGLMEGKLVRQGEVIGYVGDSGNAGAGNYHLHFSVGIVVDPKRYWESPSINPFPLLRGK